MKKSVREESRGIETSENRILLAFLLNLVFTFVEVWGSVMTGSVTILSDAVHDFGDCIALAMAWRMEKIAKRPANVRYPFGYGRFSVVAGLINTIILLIGGIVLIVTSLHRLFDPRSIDGRGMLMFAVFGIVINGAAMLLTSKGRNVNEKTISMHMLEDVLTWVAVLLVGGVMCFYELPMLDSLLSIGMTLVIFVGVLRNLKRIFEIITVQSPLIEKEYRELEERLEEMNEFGSIEALRVFTMDGQDRNAEVCLVLYEEVTPEDMMLLFGQAERCCREFGIGRSVIQFRYEVGTIGKE